MSTIIDGFVADDIHGEHSVLVFCGDGFDDDGLVDGAAHGDGVVSGCEDEVGECGCAD